MKTTVVSKEQLKGIFDTDTLEGTVYQVTITPVSEEEADEIEFKSLKGIAGEPLDLDKVRRERLNSGNPVEGAATSFAFVAAACKLPK